MKVKEKFLGILVNTYYESYCINHIGDLLTEVTSPYDELICELLNIDDDEYQEMIKEACSLGQKKYFKKVLRDMERYV